MYCLFFSFLSRNKRKLEQAREKLKDTDLAKDKEKEAKTKKELQELEKKVSISRSSFDSMYYASRRTPASCLTISLKHKRKGCFAWCCTCPAVYYCCLSKV